MSIQILIVKELRRRLALRASPWSTTDGRAVLSRLGGGLSGRERTSVEGRWQEVLKKGDLCEMEADEASVAAVGTKG